MAQQPPVVSYPIDMKCLLRHFPRYSPVPHSDYNAIHKTVVYNAKWDCELLKASGERNASKQGLDRTYVKYPVRYTSPRISPTIPSHLLLLIPPKPLNPSRLQALLQQSNRAPLPSPCSPQTQTHRPEAHLTAKTVIVMAKSRQVRGRTMHQFHPLEITCRERIRSLRWSVGKDVSRRTRAPATSVFVDVCHRCRNILS